MQEPNESKKPDRICPSDYRPKSAAEAVERKRRRKSPGSKAFAAGLKRPQVEVGPNYVACLEFVNTFTNGPHERQVWGEYRQFKDVAEKDRPTVEAEALEAGLSIEELIHEETLIHLKWFVGSKGISPPAATAGTVETTNGLSETCDDWLGWRPVNEYATDAGASERAFRRYLEKFREQGRAKNRPGEKKGDINMKRSAFEECKRQPQS